MAAIFRTQITDGAGVFRIKQGDRKPPLEFVALDDEALAPVNLTGATSVSFIFRKRTAAVATAVVQPAVIVNPEAGQLRYDWQASDTASAGDYYGEFRVTFPDGERTFPARKYISFVVEKDLNT